MALVPFCRNRVRRTHRLEATIRPLAGMISRVVVSTTKPPEGASPLGAGTARISSVTGNTLSLLMLYEIAVSKVKVCAKNYKVRNPSSIGGIDGVRPLLTPPKPPPLAGQF
jgi:hypothetical protein